MENLAQASNNLVCCHPRNLIHEQGFHGSNNHFPSCNSFLWVYGNAPLHFISDQHVHGFVQPQEYGEIINSNTNIVGSSKKTDPYHKLKCGLYFNWKASIPTIFWAWKSILQLLTFWYFNINYFKLLFWNLNFSLEVFGNSKCENPNNFNLLFRI